MGTKLSSGQKASMLKALSSKFRDGKGGVLRCLVDANSHKLAQRLFYDYISDSNFSKFPLFLQELDQLLHKFGAKTITKEELEDDEDIIPTKRKSKRDE